ncbi:MAG TPA: tryptophan synthase subunit alpha [Candidatus Sulfotelmatobacter sp.]|nr:tryptophan synthase subunit alpha [Candidatus Sulfotelmatobacter sp.]
MNNIDLKLIELKKKKRIGLMTHVVIGYPSLQETITLVKTMVECGIDFVELQIPFSDPLADGPTIMKACEQSLAYGTKVKDAFSIMKVLSSQVSIPLLFMAYYNIVFQYGVEQFCRDAKAAGASGLIVPDMPIDEEHNEYFYLYAKKYNLYTIQVISPASTPDRLSKNVSIANGFVYCTARQGITGAKKELESSLRAYLKNVKKVFTIPVAVGFGISRREHISALQKEADVAIIGSAIIDVIQKTDKKIRMQAVKQFINELRIE